MEDKVLDLAQLNDTYKDKWVNEFGNTSNSRLEELWADMFKSLELVVRKNSIRRRGIKDVPEELKQQSNIVYSATMGAGKSTVLLHYLGYGFDTQIYKALIIVELKNTCNEYERLLKHKGAVAVHSGTKAYVDDSGIEYPEVPKRELEDYLDAPILIITHERLTSLLRRGIADEVFNQYDLVAIDEQLNTYQHIQLTYKHIGTKVLNILKDNFIEDELIFKLFNSIRRNMEKYRESESNTIDIINRYSDDRDSIADWSRVADRLEAIAKDRNNSLEKKERVIINSQAIACRAISKQGRMKVVYYQKAGNQISFNVMVDFMPIHISKIMFDGTASINDTYKFLNEHIGENTVEVKKFHKGIRTFKNMTIKYYTTNPGKNSMSIDPEKVSAKEYAKKLPIVKEGLRNLVENTKKRYGANEEVLFIVHKLNAELLEPLLKGTNYKYTWWGKHVGSNAWKQCKKVVIYGLNYLPENVYVAKYYATYSAKTKLAAAPIDDLKASQFSSDILQGIMRGAGRVVVDTKGNCSPDVEVILSLPKAPLKDNILNRLRVVLPDVEIQEITDGAHPKKTETINKKKMQSLLDTLKSRLQMPLRDNNKKKSYRANGDHFCILPKETGMDTKTIGKLFTTGAYAEENTQLLLDNNWVYTSITPEEKIACGFSGNVKKVFKYIGEFKDEAPDVDVNGNEF